MGKFVFFTCLCVIFYSCKKLEEVLPVSASNQDFTKANDFLENSTYDSAYYYYNKVVSSERDSNLIGSSLFNMAIIQSMEGDYFGSYESAIQSLNYFKPHQKAYRAAVYNTIAINKNDLKEYDEAIEWYKRSISINENTANRFMFQNNLAVAFYKTRKYGDAKIIYSTLLKNDTVLSNAGLLSKVIDNFAYTKWLQNPGYPAASEFLKALSIRERENDQWGQNSSYAHLADYYAKKKLDSALFYANKMYEVAQKIGSPDDQIEALQKLIRLSPAESTKRYFEIHQQLSDSIQLARNAAKNQFALIRYETEKHKADNLQLQQDNTEKRYQIVKQQIILFTTLFVVLLVSGLSVFWYKRRRQRLALAAENAIRESQLRTSKKVHDVVANGLYRVMAEIENQRHIDREGILDLLESMYEKSRDISYEVDKLPAKPQSFNERIADLLRSFATETTKVIIAGNEANLWENVSERAKYEIEHILQELMVNMKKHSGATHVVVKFEKEHNDIHIHYSDDGIGVPETFRYHNGLTNTGNRINELQGKIIFDTETEKGLKIQISFPIS